MEGEGSSLQTIVGWHSLGRTMENVMFNLMWLQFLCSERLWISHEFDSINTFFVWSLNHSLLSYVWQSVGMRLQNSLSHLFFPLSFPHTYSQPSCYVLLFLFWLSLVDPKGSVLVLHDHWLLEGLCEFTVSLHCKKETAVFTVKYRQLWLPEFHRNKYSRTVSTRTSYSY